MGPLHGQACAEMPDCSLGRIIGCLWLWNVDNRATHAANHDHATRNFALHKMFRNTNSEEVGAINIDTPELLDTIVRVRDGVKILSEASRGNKVVDLAM